MHCAAVPVGEPTGRRGAVLRLELARHPLPGTMVLVPSSDLGSGTSGCLAKCGAPSPNVMWLGCQILPTMDAACYILLLRVLVVVYNLFGFGGLWGLSLGAQAFAYRTFADT